MQLSCRCLADWDDGRVKRTMEVLARRSYNGNGFLNRSVEVITGEIYET